MVFKVVTLPLRVTLGVTRIYLGATASTVRLTTRLTGQVAVEIIDLLQHRGTGSPTRGDSAAPRSSSAAAPTAAESDTNTSAPAPSEGAVAAASEPGSAGPAAVAEPVEPDLDTVSPFEEQPDTPLTEQESRIKTVDDDDELVGEYAEFGAEDGAGAQLAVGEPWAGYDHADLEALTNEIAGADAAEVAMIELYEQANKNRATVLDAAEKRLRALANGA